MNQQYGPWDAIRDAAQRLVAGSIEGRRFELPAGASLAGAGPTPLAISAPEDGYDETYRDVARARALWILRDPAVHHTLYGRQQGRRYLPRLTADIERVVMISPSHLKQCGIGEYGRYLSGELARQVAQVEVVRTSSAAIALGRDFLDGALVLVNHGPGLYDGLNPRLSQGESTTRLLQNLDLMAREMGAAPLIIHHSLLDTDHDLLFSRQQQILNAEIPSLTFISSAGRHFFIPSLELGVSPVPVPQHTYEGNRDERPEIVGFFGFFQYGGKDFDSLFHLARELRGELVGSVATGNADELRRFEQTIEDFDLPHNFGSGWVTDTELLERLMEADYFYLPQNDYDHWNNSATARFVTNLDRPLFLPPHHPFLDMEDGSIFAGKEDLPRIVAHFRETGHYEQAVDRVRAFRERASMSQTATAVRTSLVDRMSEVGQQLLETPQACSAERMLELSPEARPDFAAAVGVAEDDLLALPALYRAPEPRQYWRKHYELGDLLHATPLETVHAIYMAFTKRPVAFGELLRLLNDKLDKGDVPDLAQGPLAHRAILQAFEDKGGIFHDPDVVLLENGALAEDWTALIAPEGIEAFSEAKTARRADIRKAVAEAGGIGPQPEIRNLAELLLLPAEVIRQRRAAIDLAQIDLDFVHIPRNLAQRMNRLVSEANRVGLRLGDHLVFDQLEPREVEPQVHSYAREDFIFYEGDIFLLNAIRCIDKRNPFPIEMIALSGMLNAFGKTEVLRHLLHRAEGRVRIVNIDADTAMLHHGSEVQRFLQAARDPLFGLIRARNALEIAKRNNGRWWLRNKSECDALWQDSQGNRGLLTLLYAYLSETATDRAHPAGRRQDPIWRIDAQGSFLAFPGDTADALPVRSGQTIALTLSLSEKMARSANGFFPVEDVGAWTSGPQGTLSLAFKGDVPEGSRMTLKMGCLGATEAPRDLVLALLPGAAPAMPLLQDGVAEPSVLAETSARVESDAPGDYHLLLPALAPGPYALRIKIDHAVSPLELGISQDPRPLGMLVQSLCLSAPDTHGKT